MFEREEKVTRREERVANRDEKLKQEEIIQNAKISEAKERISATRTVFVQLIRHLQRCIDVLPLNPQLSKYAMVAACFHKPEIVKVILSKHRRAILEPVVVWLVLCCIFWFFDFGPICHQIGLICWLLFYGLPPLFDLLTRLTDVLINIDQYRRFLFNFAFHVQTTLDFVELIDEEMPK